jgi:hypothetical protein
MGTAPAALPDTLTAVCSALAARGVKQCRNLAELIAFGARVKEIESAGKLRKPDKKGSKETLHTAGDLRARVTAGLLLNPDLAVRYHEVRPGILLYDPFLYTLGLVDAVAADEKDIEGAFSRSLDSSAHLRQLCRQWRRTGRSGPSPRSW